MVRLNCPAVKNQGRVRMRPLNQGDRQSRSVSKPDAGRGTRPASRAQGGHRWTANPKDGGTRRRQDVGTSRPHPDLVGSLGQTIQTTQMQVAFLGNELILVLVL